MHRDLSLTWADAIARYGDHLRIGFDLLIDASGVDGAVRPCLLCEHVEAGACRVLLLTEQQRWWFDRPLCGACAARGLIVCRAELLARIDASLAGARLQEDLARQGARLP
jgi:hypothetical protein